MDGIAGPTMVPPDTAAPAESAAAPARTEPRPLLWAWPKMHQLLFVAFTLVAAVPIAVLAIWEGQNAFQNELDSVRERHLLVARNLTSTMSRYVKDLKATFPLAFAHGSMTQPDASLVHLLESLEVIRVCILNPDGSVASRLPGLADYIETPNPPDPAPFRILRALADD